MEGHIKKFTDDTVAPTSGWYDCRWKRLISSYPVHGVGGATRRFAPRQIHSLTGRGAFFGLFVIATQHGHGGIQPPSFNVRCGNQSGARSALDVNIESVVANEGTYIYAAVKERGISLALS